MSSTDNTHTSFRWRVCSCVFDWLQTSRSIQLLHAVFQSFTPVLLSHLLLSISITQHNVRQGNPLVSIAFSPLSDMRVERSSWFPWSWAGTPTVS